MANLKLKATKKGLPPDVGPRVQAVDYYNRAVQSWLQAQLNAYQLQDIEIQRQALADRITNGKQWIEEHGAEPKAQRLLYRLQDQLNAVDISHTELLKTTWRLCTDVYVSWTHCDTDERWRWTMEFNMNDIEHPRELWKRLELGRSPPGNWPHDDAEWWIQ